MGILIRDALAVAVDEEETIGRRDILIEGDRIARIAPPRRLRGGRHRLIDGTSFVAIPGLFNGHVHADIALARGLADGLTLYEQDQDSFVSRRHWFRDDLGVEGRKLSRLLQYAESLKGGTTYICDVPFWWRDDDLVTPLKETGADGSVVMDYRLDFLTGERAEREVYLLRARELRGAGYEPIVEAPAEEGFDRDLLLELAGWAEELDTFIHLHLAETIWRVRLVEERYGLTPVRYLEKIGFLSGRVIGSHGVYVDAEEMDLLQAAGSRVVNCPVAEMKIGDGVAPVSGFLERGVPFTLGTDGALWNDSGDLFGEMKTLLLLQRVTRGVGSISPREVLRAATRGGAATFGRDGDLGSLRAGYRANLVLVDTRSPHLTPLYHGSMSNVVENLVSCARASDVHTVIVGGRIVVDDHRLTTLDEGALLEECRRYADLRLKNMPGPA